MRKESRKLIREIKKISGYKLKDVSGLELVAGEESNDKLTDSRNFIYYTTHIGDKATYKFKLEIYLENRDYFGNIRILEKVLMETQNYFESKNLNVQVRHHALTHVKNYKS